MIQWFKFSMRVPQYLIVYFHLKGVGKKKGTNDRGIWRCDLSNPETQNFDILFYLFGVKILPLDVKILSQDSQNLKIGKFQRF